MTGSTQRRNTELDFEPFLDRSDFEGQRGAKIGCCGPLDVPLARSAGFENDRVIFLGMVLRSANMCPQ